MKKARPEIMISNGQYFNFKKPHLAVFSIDEIAHALSNLCRFTGQCRKFYSVAQHSVIVSYLVPPDDALWGLLHDAPEAFIGDVSSPLKQLLPDYKAIEKAVEKEILARFGLVGSMPTSVHHADLLALRLEQRDVMHSKDVWSATETLSAPLFRIKPMKPKKARKLFLARYWELIQAANQGHRIT